MTAAACKTFEFGDGGLWHLADALTDRLKIEQLCFIAGNSFR